MDRVCTNYTGDVLPHCDGVFFNVVGHGEEKKKRNNPYHNVTLLLLFLLLVIFRLSDSVTSYLHFERNNRRGVLLSSSSLLTLGMHNNMAVPIILRPTQTVSVSTHIVRTGNNGHYYVFTAAIVIDSCVDEETRGKSRCTIERGGGRTHGEIIESISVLSFVTDEIALK